MSPLSLSLQLADYRRGRADSVGDLLLTLLRFNATDLSGDFEIIRGVKGVIALEEDEFGAASLAELGVAEEGDEEDEWELLGLEDEEEGVSKEVKPQGKSWASIVGRS